MARLGVCGDRADDVALLVSEVVTNAVRHGGARDEDHVTVELTSEDHRLRIRVLDGGGGLPAQRRPGSDGGFGLHLVEALADDWGAAPGEVWFVLAV
ncbi:ATP-binding protein [Conexibacter sp. SYSU D00693]|uniref:ATP-binding protein n=1 Tax=Conexibacter sp. SYSU D00693 TaxID=2812560 RepID=UPI00196B5B5B|nr:ATP-binding protein [Conexibacter sp. SYSU D00693]